MEAILSKTDYQHYFEKGVSFDAYMRNMEQKASGEIPDKYAQYIPMNLQRSQRLIKTVTLTPEILSILEAYHHKVNWLLMSEGWCGDASQIVPVIAKIAAASKGLIDLRIVSSDNNPALMDAHLTPKPSGKGSRSVPKLIQLDSQYNFTGIWGPRPNEAQKLVYELRANPETAATYGDVLHKWYADNKQAFIQRDLLKLLKLGTALCPDCKAH
jgi:hypothetical protein